MTKTEKTFEEDTASNYYFHHKKHAYGLMGGLILVFIGVVFLLNNIGILPSSVWNEVWKFWPVLFILFGLRLLAGRNTISRMIIALVTLFAFAGVLAYLLFYYGLLRNFGF